MPTESIPFRKTNYFSDIICDYLDESPDLVSFYGRYPKLENFKAQIEEKQSSVKAQSRITLFKALKDQYNAVNASEETLQNIDDLQLQNTFTITTGHQLNLFTGPLYFLYKIISTINLTKRLKAEYPSYNFVPVYWMASEDHDFEEINYFNFKGKKIRWNSNQTGAVGHFNLQGLQDVYEVISEEFGVGNFADQLKAWFKEAYLNHDNLADATRYLANALFGTYGLVIINADHRELKRLFIPQIEKDISDQSSYQHVLDVNKQLEALGYDIQVNPREINFFYIKEGLRERIVYENGMYGVLNTNIVWSQEAFKEHVQNHPERFSPNVIMRPMYQEVILPNLCYIGGGGELAYWFQLKSNFESHKVTFPMLLLRNSVLVKSEKQQKKLHNLNISSEDLFLKRESFINKKVRQISNIDIDFSSQKTHLKTQFDGLYKLAEQTDKSFLGAVKAQEVKQMKGLEHLENRLLKAQKRKLADEVERITDLQEQLFPGQSLQERNANFSQFYLEYGDKLIEILMAHLNPLVNEFTVLTI